MNSIYFSNDNNICDVDLYNENGLLKFFVKGKIRDYVPIILKYFVDIDEETHEGKFKPELGTVYVKENNTSSDMFLAELHKYKVDISDIQKIKSMDIRDVFPVGADIVLNKMISESETESVIKYLETNGITCRDAFGNLLSLEVILSNIAKKYNETN